jgi:tetratricopeptide (TPR) repeat protein
LLRQALAIDARYAPAAAMIGWCRIHQIGHGLGPISDAELTEAVWLAKTAIEVGKQDPDVLWMAGRTLEFLAGEHAAGTRIIDRALALNPNSAHAWMVRGSVSVGQNQPDRAIEAFNHAMRLSPLDPLRRAFALGLGAAHFAAGRYEEAIEWSDQPLAAQPDYRPALRIKIASLAQLGQIEAARDWLGRLLDLEPGLTITGWKEALKHFSPELLAAYAEGLRKAGLPEK